VVDPPSSDFGAAVVGELIVDGRPEMKRRLLWMAGELMVDCWLMAGGLIRVHRISARQVVDGSGGIAERGDANKARCFLSSFSGLR